MLNKEETAPFIPKISGAGDFSNFDVYKDEVISGKASKCLFERDFIDF